jgi:hypothetical protein
MITLHTGLNRLTSGSIQRAIAASSLAFCLAGKIVTKQPQGPEKAPAPNKNDEPAWLVSEADFANGCVSITAAQIRGRNAASRRTFVGGLRITPTSKRSCLCYDPKRFTRSATSTYSIRARPSRRARLRFVRNQWPPHLLEDQLLRSQP